MSLEVLAERINNTHAIAMDAQAKLEKHKAAVKRDYISKDVYETLTNEVGRLRLDIRENTKTRLMLLGALLLLQPIVAYLVVQVST